MIWTTTGVHTVRAGAHRLAALARTAAARVAQGADQFNNAEAIEFAGSGARLLGDDQSAEAVAAAGKKLLADDDIRAVARAGAAEIAAMPSPEMTVAVFAQR